MSEQAEVEEAHQTDHGRKILVLVDGSEASGRAFEKALELKTPNDTLYICHACEFSTLLIPVHEVSVLEDEIKSYRDAVRERGHQIGKQYLSICKERGVTHVHTIVITTGEPREAVLEFAEANHVGLIVVGTRGLGTLKRLVLGSFSDYIAHHANCDVLLVK
eukprot:c40904_g1_i1.p1 GENE.c40904_g1_i1~~c40904_g1_i1.p1  ORF type:complete len:173 (-),score=33.70 c40904_g1_i1:96-581(-)